MCGIAGIVANHSKIEPNCLNKTIEALVHRGPDNHGYFLEKSVALIHTRLSIIDIGGGSQPMFNEDKNLVIVFNGEIYNFLDLRDELEFKGHRFSTRSDTETILHAYEQWGTDCPKKLSGMFAFAVLDRKKRSVFLCRDRCGEKPLFYAIHNNGFAFASEIKPLLSLIEYDVKPDNRSIYHYLRLGYIPSPRSFYDGIKKLEPGAFIVFENNRIKQKAFYYRTQLQSIKSKHSENQLCDELEDLLLKAVNRMLISDVPLGAFLSGGLDSSLITAMMVKLGQRPRTFSISFGPSSFDETPFAQKVSELLGTDHTRHTVEFEDFCKNLEIMDQFGEPFADYSGIPTWYLSKETRKKVTVALTGDGSDELFGGYRRYVAQQIAYYYQMIPLKFRKKIIGKLISKMSDTDDYYANSFIKSVRLFIERVEASNNGLMFNSSFSHEDCEALFPDIHFTQESIYKPESCDLLEELMAMDRLMYLPDDILVKVDRMSMQNSLETRAPYLDPTLLEFSDRLPVALKINGLVQKYLLKKLALRYLPKDIVFRKKHGFMAPMQQWIKNVGRIDIKRRMPSIANSKAIDALLDDFFNKQRDYSYKIFSLIMLGRYLN